MKVKIKEEIASARKRTAVNGIPVEIPIETVINNVQTVKKRLPGQIRTVRLNDTLSKWNHQFAVKLQPCEEPNKKAAISVVRIATNEERHIGFIRSEVSTGYLVWHYSDVTGKLLGTCSNRNPAEAAYLLLKQIVLDPIQKAEAAAREAKRPYFAPLTIDGVTFTFDRGDIVESRIGEKRTFIVTWDGEFDWTYRHKVQQGDTLTAINRHADWGRISTSNKWGDDVWIGYYESNSGWSSHRDWNEGVPLEVILRWLCLHQTFYNVRCVQSLYCYQHSIERLILAGEQLFSRNTYRELCGFLPISDETKYKLYIQTYWDYHHDQPPPTEHFNLAFLGDRDSAIKESYRRRYEDSSRRDLGFLLLNEKDELVEWNAATRPINRYFHNWESIFTHQSYEERSAEDRFTHFRKHDLHLEVHPAAEPPN